MTLAAEILDGMAEGKTQRLGVEKKKPVREEKGPTLTGRERSDLIGKIWRSKHRDYRSTKSDVTHPSVLVMGKKGGTELWPLRKISDKDLLWLAKREGFKVDRQRRDVSKTVRGTWEGKRGEISGFDHLPSLRESLSKLGAQSIGEAAEVRESSGPLAEGKLRQGTKAEFVKASAKANQPPRYMHTKRSMDVEYRDRGTVVASKHQTLKRGKVDQESYMVNPDYL